MRWSNLKETAVSMPIHRWSESVLSTSSRPPVWKRYYFVQRNPDIPAEEFAERWGKHGDLGGTFPDGLKRHPRTSYGLVRTVAGGSTQLQFDGVGMLWLGSPEWADRASSDPLHRPTMLQDELRVFRQPVYDSAMLAEERISKPGSFSKAALLRFFRREKLSDADFGIACDAVRRALSQSPFDSQVTRCAWSTVVRTPTIAFDSCMEFWFATPELASAALADEEFRKIALQPMDFVTGLNASQASDCDVSYLAEICHTRIAPDAPD